MSDLINDNEKITGNSFVGFDFTQKNLFLSDQDFTDLDLSNASFKGMTIANTSFERAILKGTDFRNTKLENVNFDEAEMGLSASKRSGPIFLYRLESFSAGLVLAYSAELLLTLIAAPPDPVNTSRIFVGVSCFIFFPTSFYIAKDYGFGQALATFIGIFIFASLGFTAIIQNDLAIVSVLQMPCLIACLTGVIVQAQSVFLKSRVSFFSEERGWKYEIPALSFFGMLVGAFLAILIWPINPLFCFIVSAILSATGFYFGSEASVGEDNDGLDIIRQVPDLFLGKLITSFKYSIADERTTFAKSQLCKADYAFSKIESASLDRTGIERKNALILKGNKNSNIVIIEGNVVGSVLQIDTDRSEGTVNN